jgi:uncharacterized membrane protein
VIRLVLLIAILTLAGLVHLLDPFSFVNAIPTFIPNKLEIIFWTGILEFVFAVGLILKKTRALFSDLIALYFILLIPIHVYVSWNSIAMFGIQDPVLLWMRTLFQLVFVWWARTLRKV